MSAHHNPGSLNQHLRELDFLFLRTRLPAQRPPHIIMQAASGQPTFLQAMASGGIAGTVVDIAL